VGGSPWAQDFALPRRIYSSNYDSLNCDFSTSDASCIAYKSKDHCVCCDVAGAAWKRSWVASFCA
jgi:hypothetical protein